MNAIFASLYVIPDFERYLLSCWLNLQMDLAMNFDPIRGGFSISLCWSSHVVFWFREHYSYISCLSWIRVIFSIQSNYISFVCMKFACLHMKQCYRHEFDSMSKNPSDDPHLWQYDGDEDVYGTFFFNRKKSKTKCHWYEWRLVIRQMPSSLYRRLLWRIWINLIFPRSFPLEQLWIRRLKCFLSLDG